MNKYKTIILFLFLTLFIFSQEKQDRNEKKLSLSLNQAIEMAIKNNLDLKSKSLDQKSNEWKLYSLWNTFLPDISLSMNMIKSNLSEEDRTVKQTIYIPVPSGSIGYHVIPQEISFTRPEWGASVGFSLNWTLNAAMVFSSYQTVIDYQRGKITLEDAKNKLIKDIKKMYYSITLQREDLNIKRNELKAKQDRFNQTERNFKNGLVPKLLMLRSQVAYESIVPQVTEKENNLKQSIDMFKILIGVPPETEIDFTESLENIEKVLPDEKTIFENFENRNLTLQNLYLTKQTILNSLNLSISSLTPTFQLGFTAQPTFQKDPAKDDWFKDPKDWKDTQGMLRFTLIFPLSKYIPFSKDQVNIIGANYAIQKMNYDIQSYKNVTKNQINTLLDKIKKSKKQIDATTLSIKVAEEAYELAKKEFQLGTKELLDVQDTENELNNMRLLKLMAIFDYISNVIELEYIINSNIK